MERLRSLVLSPRAAPMLLIGAVVVVYANIYGNGWHYDNDQAPTRIILDAAVCERIKEEGAQRVDLVHGCPTLQ